MVCTIGTRTFDIRSVLDEEVEGDDNSSGDMIVVREVETIRHGVDELQGGAPGKPAPQTLLLYQWRVCSSSRTTN